MRGEGSIPGGFEIKYDILGVRSVVVGWLLRLILINLSLGDAMNLMTRLDIVRYLILESFYVNIHDHYLYFISVIDLHG
jgi:hypothetical protein